MASGRIKIEVTVESNFDDALYRASHTEVHKEPGACEKCVENNDPDRIPMHPNCRCTIVFVND